MTIKQFRNIIKEVDKTKVLEIQGFFTINQGPNLGDLRFDSINELYEWLHRENTIAAKNPPSTSSILKNSVSNLSFALERLKALANHLSAQPEFEPNQILNLWNQTKRDINPRINNSNHPLLLPSNPVFKFLLTLEDRVTDQALSIIHNYLVLNQMPDIRHPHNFEAALLAFDFKHQGENTAPARARAERKSVDDTHIEFQKIISSAYEQLDEYQELFNQKQSSFQSEFTRLTKTVNDAESTRKNDFLQWFNDTKANNQEYEQTRRLEIENLENLYQEKLRLEKPAVYWNKRAVELNHTGKVWTIWLMTSIAFGVILLFSLILFISTDEISKIFTDAGKAIRWSITFVVFISFLAYAVRIFAKLMFSSYHLARDAEEREQLVHVYLSLSHEKTQDEASRNLILQAIFSRADTGLLKEDSSPTMPGASSILGRLSN